MHDTAYEHGRLFFETYWRPEFDVVVDLGSQDVNGSLRDHCPAGARYIGLDMEASRGVDIVVEPGAPLPFADGSVDVVVTTSAFEHDVFFWQTFLELARVIRPGGLIYLNAPSNNDFHRYPLDCWRFYPDAGIALSRWAAERGVPVDLVESFVAEPRESGWADFVAVFRKPSTEPWGPAGRMADKTSARNVFTGSETDLEAHEPETFEVREMTRLGGDLSQAQQERAQAREELAQAQLEVARLRTEVARIRAKARAKDARVAALRLRNRRLRSAARSAERTVEQMRSSASWRLTGPLRRAKGLLRRR